MYALDNYSKKRLVNELIDIRTELTWSAQLRNENTEDYGARIQELLKQYNNAGVILWTELFEVTDSTEDRERLAIYSFIRGLRSEVKKYIYELHIYNNLTHARNHARRITRRLEDIERLQNDDMSIVNIE